MKDQTTISTLDSATIGSTTASSTVQLATAAPLGFVVLFGAGFVNTSAAHNAAPDMCHAQGVPCH